MRWFARSALVAVVLAVAASPARADLMYAFDRTEYVAEPGRTVEVSVYLRETINPGEVSLLAGEGLFSAGVRLRWDVPPVPADPAGVRSAADVLANPAFDDPAALVIDLVSGQSVGLVQGVGFTNPAGVIGGGGPLTYEILLGRFVFRAGGIPGTVTRLTAVDFGPFDDTLTNVTGAPLDALIRSGEARIVVQPQLAPVPEPGTLTLLGVGATLAASGVLGRPRSRHAPVTAAGTPVPHPVEPPGDPDDAQPER